MNTLQTPNTLFTFMLVYHTGLTVNNENLVSFNLKSKQENKLYKSSNTINSKDLKNGIYYFVEKNKIKSFDIKSNELKEILELKDENSISDIKLSEDGNKMIINTRAFSSDSTLCNSKGDNNNFNIKTSPIIPSCSYVYVFNIENKNIKKIYTPQFQSNYLIDNIKFSSDNRYVSIFDLTEINIFDSVSGEVIYNKNLSTDRIKNLVWIDENNFVYNLENREIIFHNIKENIDKKVNFDGNIQLIYNNKLLVTSTYNPLSNLYSIDINDLSVKQIGAFVSQYIFVFYDKNLNKLLVEEPLPDSRKVNFYTIDNDRINEFAKINLGQTVQEK